MNRAAVMGIFAMALVAFAGVSPAGQEAGPPTPGSPEAKWSIGAGYYYYQARWKAGDNMQLDLSDVGQNILFGEVGYGFTPDWEAYLRVGGADWSSMGALPVTPGGDLEAGYKPCFSIGLRGSIFRRSPFAVGFAGQYSYFSGYDITATGETGIDLPEPYEAAVKFKDLYGLDLGINFDYAPGWGVIYLGWFWFRGAGKVDASIKVGDDDADTFAGDIEENADMGGFGGIRLDLGRGYAITAEGQYRTKASLSLSVNKILGV